MILECHHTCKACTQSPTATAPLCTACDTTMNRNDYSSTCKTCPCLPGYYDDGTNALCQCILNIYVGECPSNCLTCSLNPVAGGTPPVICTMCPNPLTTLNYTSPASPTCECLIGFVLNPNTNLCSRIK